ncbi:MAG: YaaR family protein [Treponemataceae bacterium]|nr:YaaR family protein [Treponemataceae bacterium]
MGTEINVNQYVTAAQLSAGKTSGGRNEKVEKGGGIRKKFSEILHKNESVSEPDPYLPVEIEGLEFEEALSFLLDKVTMASEYLKKNPFTEAFADYRKKISQFMRFVVKNCYDVEESLGTPTIRVPRPKKKYLIKVVDDKLDQLAREILENHVDQLKMLAKVDEINGLLVDMLS